MLSSPCSLVCQQDIVYQSVDTLPLLRIGTKHPWKELQRQNLEVWRKNICTYSERKNRRPHVIVFTRRIWPGFSRFCVWFWRCCCWVLCLRSALFSAFGECKSVAHSWLKSSSRTRLLIKDWKKKWETDTGMTLSVSTWTVSLEGTTLFCQSLWIPQLSITRMAKCRQILVEYLVLGPFFSLHHKTPLMYFWSDARTHLHEE
jgi:hypothetical protein